MEYFYMKHLLFSLLSRKVRGLKVFNKDCKWHLIKMSAIFLNIMERKYYLVLQR